MDTIAIPEKPYFRIGEAARLLGVEPSVLRYWESEFPQVAPTRAPSRQRLYHKNDLELLFYIRDLLYQEGYTISGARKRLAEARRAKARAAAAAQASAAAPAATEPEPEAVQAPAPEAALSQPEPLVLDFAPPTSLEPSTADLDQSVRHQVLCELKEILARLEQAPGRA